jgi:TatA/E family protein of Tat protein translocase
MNLLGTLGLTSLLLILALVVLLFGSTLIPRLFRSLGQIRREFHRGEGDDETPDDR